MHCRISKASRISIRASRWNLQALVVWLATLGAIAAPLASRAQKEEPQRTITVKGKLDRVMAIGGESTGWSIHLSEEITIDGKQLTSIEIDFPNTKKLEETGKQRSESDGHNHIPARSRNRRAAGPQGKLRQRNCSDLEPETLRRVWSRALVACAVDHLYGVRQQRRDCIQRFHRTRRAAGKIDDDGFRANARDAT